MTTGSPVSHPAAMRTMTAAQTSTIAKRRPANRAHQPNNTNQLNSQSAVHHSARSSIAQVKG